MLEIRVHAVRRRTMRHRADRKDARGIVQLLRAGLRGLLGSTGELINNSFDLADESGELSSVQGVRPPRIREDGQF